MFQCFLFYFDCPIGGCIFCVLLPVPVFPPFLLPHLCLVISPGLDCTHLCSPAVLSKYFFPLWLVLCVMMAVSSSVAYLFELSRLYIQVCMFVSNFSLGSISLPLCLISSPEEQLHLRSEPPEIEQFFTNHICTHKHSQQTPTHERTNKMCFKLYTFNYIN